MTWRVPAGGTVPHAARLPDAQGRRRPVLLPRALTNSAPHVAGRVGRRIGMASTLRTTPNHQTRLLAVLLMAPFMAQADVTIANVAAPSIHADLRTSGAELELVVGGYLIAFAVLLITGARLGQTHGYRRVFLLGASVFTAASLLCGLAPGPIVLIGARVLQGAGAALMFPQTLTGIQLSFEGAERARAIGLYAIALSSGAVAGQVLGGVLVSADLLDAAWRSVFFVNVPVGAAVIVAGARYLPPEGRREARGIDVAGVATLSAAVLLVVVPLVLGRAEGWPAWAWVSMAASAPALAAFVATERGVRERGGAPLVNLHALAPRPVACGLLAVATAISTYYALLFTLALYLQQGLGHSALASGLTLVSWVAAFGAAGQIVRRLPPRFGPHVAPAGCLLLAGAYVALSASLLGGEPHEALLVVLLGVGGLGLGTQFSALIAHLTNAVSARYAPDVSGVTTTTMQIAGALGIAAFGTVYLSLAADGPATHAFAVVTAAFAAIAVLAALLAAGATRPSAVRPRAAPSAGRAPGGAGRT
jgi:MFS family permease